MQFSSRIWELFRVPYNPWSPLYSTGADTVSPVLQIMRKWHGDLITCPGSSVKLIDNTRSKQKWIQPPQLGAERFPKPCFILMRNSIYLYNCCKGFMLSMRSPPAVSPCLVLDTNPWLCLWFCCLCGCWLYFMSYMHRNKPIFGEVLGQQHRSAHPSFPALQHWSRASEMAVEPIKNKFLMLAAAVHFAPAVPHTWTCHVSSAQFWFTQVHPKSRQNICPGPFGLKFSSRSDKPMLSCLLECLCWV